MIPAPLASPRLAVGGGCPPAPSDPRFRGIYPDNPILGSFGTMKALNPVCRHLSGQASPLISHTLPGIPSPTTILARLSLYSRLAQRNRCVSGFAITQQARRHVPPNRVRPPTDCHFASGCSPPRLATTQLPSATGLRLTPVRTFTVQCVRLHGRTGSGFSRTCKPEGLPTEASAESALDTLGSSANEESRKGRGQGATRQPTCCFKRKILFCDMR